MRTLFSKFIIFLLNRYIISIYLFFINSKLPSLINHILRYNGGDKKFVDYKSKHFYMHFSRHFDENLFYWLTANTTSEFHSGYSVGSVYVGSFYSFRRIGMIINFTSPFNFLYPNNTIIKNLSMIRSTRFAFYEIE